MLVPSRSACDNDACTLNIVLIAAKVSHSRWPQNVKMNSNETSAGFILKVTSVALNMDVILTVHCKF